MSDLDDLTNLLGDSSTITSIADALGASESDTRQAVGAAIPALLGGLAVQADDPDRADGLAQALQNDHSGDIFDQLGALLGGTGSGKQFDGAGILGHLFGDEQDSVVQGLSSKTGANSSLLSKVLPMLAPIVMGWLAKKMSGASGSAATGSSAGAGGLGSILGSVLGQAGGSGSGSSSGGGLMDVIGGLLGGGSSGDSADGGLGGLGGLLGSILGGK